MPVKIIDGKVIAADLRARVADEVARVKRDHGLTPGLAVVLVGNDPASEVYVRNKARQTEAAGMASFEHKLAADTPQKDLLALIAKLNADASVHGILVQLPLPKELDTQAVINAIDPAKDVDGLHPINAGRLATDSGYFAQMWKQRSVSGVPLSLSVMTTGLAKELARRLDTGPSPTHAACAAAALASHRGRIVLYSPFLTATAPSRLAQPLDGVAVERLAKPLANLALDRRWYPEALAEAIPYRPAPLTGEAHSPSSAQDRAA
jgi:chorismate mutase